VEAPLKILSNCLGEFTRESGHSLVPMPPAKITNFISLKLYNFFGSGRVSH